MCHLEAKNGSHISSESELQKWQRQEGVSPEAPYVQSANSGNRVATETIQKLTSEFTLERDLQFLNQMLDGFSTTSRQALTTSLAELNQQRRNSLQTTQDVQIKTEETRLAFEATQVNIDSLAKQQKANQIRASTLGLQNSSSERILQDGCENLTRLEKTVLAIEEDFTPTRQKSENLQKSFQEAQTNLTQVENQLIMEHSQSQQLQLQLHTMGNHIEKHQLSLEVQAVQIGITKNDIQLFQDCIEKNLTQVLELKVCLEAFSIEELKSDSTEISEAIRLSEEELAKMSAKLMETEVQLTEDLDEKINHWREALDKLRSSLRAPLIYREELQQALLEKQLEEPQSQKHEWTLLNADGEPIHFSEKTEGNAITIKEASENYLILLFQRVHALLSNILNFICPCLFQSIFYERKFSLVQFNLHQ